MIQWLQKFAIEHSDWGKLLTPILALLAIYHWIGKHAISHYVKRAEESREWNDELREELQNAKEARDEYEAEKEKLETERENRIEEQARLENRVVDLEDHTEWCEENLMTLAGTLEEDSDVDWSVEDVLDEPERLPDES